ncbi:MAG: metallophosphoesterase family protein [Pseudonocardiales bacterium]
MQTPFGDLPNRLAVDMSMDEQHDWLRRRLTRRTLLKGASVAGASSALLWAQPTRTRAEAGQVYGRHVAYGGDPTTEMIVGFASTGPVSHAAVQLSSGQSAPADIQTVPGSPARYLRARFEALQPGANYEYTIQIDGQSVTGGSFKTAPDGNLPFRFTAFADQDVGPDSVAVLSRVAGLQPLVHLVAGDLCYADSTGAGGPGDVLKPQRWDRWLNQNDSVASRVPWMIVPGNHEMEPGYGTHGYAGMLARVAIGGSAPLDVPVASAFRLGSVGFIGLDSNDVSNEIPANRGWSAGRQTAWLESTLVDYRRPSSGIEFVVAYHHAGPYSTSASHGSEGGVRDHWVPLYDRYAVDLVVSGHNHCYERTLPLRDGKVTGTGLAEVDSRTGTTYVTAGGGGAGFNTHGFGNRRQTRVATPQGSQLSSADWSTAPRGLNHSVLCVDVTPGTAARPGRMHVRAITKNGRVMDEWTMSRSAGTLPGLAPSPSTPSWPVAAAALAGSGALLVAGEQRRRHRNTGTTAT